MAEDQDQEGKIENRGGGEGRRRGERGGGETETQTKQYLQKNVTKKWRRRGASSPLPPPYLPSLLFPPIPSFILCLISFSLSSSFALRLFNQNAFLSC